MEGFNVTGARNLWQTSFTFVDMIFGSRPTTGFARLGDTGQRNKLVCLPLLDKSLNSLYLTVFMLSNAIYQ